MGSLLAVADLRGGGGATRDVCWSSRSKFFHFHAVFSKNFQIKGWPTPDLCGGHPREILDQPLSWSVHKLAKYRFPSWIHYGSMFHLQWCGVATRCHRDGHIHGSTLVLDKCRKFDRRPHPGMAAWPCHRCLCTCVSNCWTCYDKGIIFVHTPCLSYILKKKQLWCCDDEYPNRNKLDLFLRYTSSQ